MPFSYDQLEDAVVAYLAPLMTNQVIAAYPDGESEWKEVNDKPVVYVAYTESSFEASASTDVVKQKETPLIVCNVRAEKRRGTNGVNEVIGLLKTHLQGLKISGTGCDRLQLESIKMVERDDDRKIWSYNVAFSTTKNQSQLVETDFEVSGANLQEVIFNDTVQLP